MQTTTGMITVVDRAYGIDDAAAAYARISWGLEEQGFAVQYTEPPLVNVPNVDFRGRLRAERDVVLDWARRKVGKSLVIGSVALVFFTLGLMVTGEDRRFVLEWLLTLEVIAGGYGLLLLRHPAARRRTVIEFSLVGETDGVRVEVQGGVGIVEDDVIFDWARDVPAAVTVEEIEKLLLDAQSEAME